MREVQMKAREMLNAFFTSGKLEMGRFAHVYQCVYQVQSQYDKRMSQLMEAVENGDYQRGIALFAQLASPSPVDLRWLGVCLLNESRYPEAELRFRQAIRQDDHGAHTFLAGLLISQGHNRQALEALERGLPLSLPDHDAALWYRERARIGWILGEPKTQVMDWARQAWHLCADTSTAIQTSIATFLGSLHGHFAEHEQALVYLDFAAEHGHLRRLEYVAVCQAESLIALRRFDEANVALEKVESSALLPLRELARIQLLQGRECWEEAKQAALRLLPSVLGWAAEEFKVRIALLTLMTVTGDRPQGARQILRAEQLISSPLQRADLSHRAGLSLIGEDAFQALQYLCEAREAYLKAEHRPGLLAVYLALAEVEPDRRAEHVRAAAATAATLSVLPDLTSEWPLLPDVKGYLAQLPHDAFESLLREHTSPVREVVLRTLGVEAGFAVLGDRRVSFRHSRAAEILCYLCRRQEVGLADVQRDLFPDVLPSKSKNYFHQVRVDIAFRLPGVEIGFDARRKVYCLRGRLPLLWDVQELERQLRTDPIDALKGNSVNFLPESDSEWAREERETLRRWVTQVGLETMETWFQSGEYSKCIQLAERLLPIDPLDEGLHTFLLTATYQVKGRLTALHRYHESAAVFIREIGEIPEGLQNLESTWRLVN